MYLCQTHSLPCCCPSACEQSFVPHCITRNKRMSFFVFFLRDAKWCNFPPLKTPLDNMYRNVIIDAPYWCLGLSHTPCRNTWIIFFVLASCVLFQSIGSTEILQITENCSVEIKGQSNLQVPLAAIAINALFCTQCAVCHGLRWCSCYAQTRWRGWKKRPKDCFIGFLIRENFYVVLWKEVYNSLTWHTWHTYRLENTVLKIVSDISPS